MLTINRASKRRVDFEEPQWNKRRADGDDFLTGHCGTSCKLPVFDCVVCSDTICNQHSIPVNNHQVCGGCFDRKGGYRDQFEAHLKNEMHKPKFGDADINFRALQHVFPAEFVIAYHIKLSEYAMPAAQRIYCANRTCSKYLGSRYFTYPDALLPCSKCNHKTCELCFGSIVGSPADHICEKAQEEDDNNFKDLEKGVDYQKCPRCPARIQLSEACNHMTCPCGKQFCFICGKSVDEHDQHWIESLGCPRYGAKGSPDAIFDDEPFRDYQHDVDSHVNQFIQVGRAADLGDDNLHRDLYEPFELPSGPEGNIFVRARRTYRARLYNILVNVLRQHHLNHIRHGLSIARSRAMTQPVWEVAMIALVSMDYFTAHLEHDPSAYERYFNHFQYERGTLDDALPQISEEQWARYPDLAPIITAYQLAADQSIGELHDYLYSQRGLRRL